MNNFNKCLFHNNRYITNFLYSAIISGTVFMSSAPQAGPPPEIEITEQSGVYKIKVVVVIDAHASHVRRVLTDYLHIHRLNPSIIESEVLKQHDDDSVSVRTRVIGCAAYFCACRNYS